MIAPLDGIIINLEEVPNEVFAQRMVGDGFAIDPVGNIIVSPVDGIVTTVFPSKHVVGITSNKGKEILIHVGIDTLNLKGEGFDVFVNQGDKIKAGDKIMKVDFENIKGKVPSILTCVVITNLIEGEFIEFEEGKKASLNNDVIATISKR